MPANPTQNEDSRKKTGKDNQDAHDKFITFDLPEVSDIPGQEHIKPPPLGELADVTISSAGEEGSSVFEDDLDDDETNNVSAEEIALLKNASDYTAVEDEEELKKAVPDNADLDGEALNEKIFYKDLSAADLDIPDEYEDDEDEELGKLPKQ